MDDMTPDQRHRNMSRIRSKDTAPEVIFRKKLFAMGFRYRKNVRHVPGCPDLYLAKYRTAVFIHGCYWHQHTGCRYAVLPKTRPDYWLPKLKRNAERDQEVQSQLLAQGYRYLIVWECTIRRMKKDPAYEAEVMKAAAEFLRSDLVRMEI